jgi:hypothetical protein
VVVVVVVVVVVLVFAPVLVLVGPAVAVALPAGDASLPGAVGPHAPISAAATTSTAIRRQAVTISRCCR